MFGYNFVFPENETIDVLLPVLLIFLFIYVFLEFSGKFKRGINLVISTIISLFILGGHYLNSSYGCWDPILVILNSFSGLGLIILVLLVVFIIIGGLNFKVDLMLKVLGFIVIFLILSVTASFIFSDHGVSCDLFESDLSILFFPEYLIPIFLLSFVIYYFILQSRKKYKKT